MHFNRRTVLPFYLRDDDHSPEWIQFGEIVNGRCMRLKLSGEDLWRVAAT
jgi:hypothetical protein